MRVYFGWYSKNLGALYMIDATNIATIKDRALILFVFFTNNVYLQNKLLDFFKACTLNIPDLINMKMFVFVLKFDNDSIKNYESFLIIIGLPNSSIKLNICRNYWHLPTFCLGKLTPLQANQVADLLKMAIKVFTHPYREWK